MMELYIDTHYTDLVIALLKNNKLIDKRVINSNKHSINTVTLLNEILKSNNIGIDDINLIIVINGPGSFTGVRIGVVIAKTIGYTKNISVKAISYLQALALNYNKEVIVGIRDRNGVFGGKFNKEHELIEDYFYLTNKEVESYKEEIIYSDLVDIEKVAMFLKNKDNINPHLLKPLYVKRIEVDHD